MWKVGLAILSIVQKVLILKILFLISWKMQTFLALNSWVCWGRKTTCILYKRRFSFCFCFDWSSRIFGYLKANFVLSISVVFGQNNLPKTLFLLFLSFYKVIAVCVKTVERNLIVLEKSFLTFFLCDLFRHLLFFIINKFYLNLITIDKFYNLILN